MSLSGVLWKVTTLCRMPDEEVSVEVKMERQRKRQEDIAQEMMEIARGLKGNAMAAKNIIVNDNKVTE